MKKLVDELRRVIDFKKTTVQGDIVLIAAHNPDMLIYALVRAIDRDESRRDEWWHVRMTLLSMPPRAVAWTLRNEQLTGRDRCTMGGNQRFMQAVKLPEEVIPEPEPEPEPEAKSKAVKPIRRIK
jgi:hypothetical protein